MSDERPILICAPYRAESPAAPWSTTRRCDGCFCLVMTAPSSQALVADGARLFCTDCADTAVPVDSEFQLLPAQVDELARVLGPRLTAETIAMVALLNRNSERGRN